RMAREGAGEHARAAPDRDRRGHLDVALAEQVDDGELDRGAFGLASRVAQQPAERAIEPRAGRRQPDGLRATDAHRETALGEWPRLAADGAREGAVQTALAHAGPLRYHPRCCSSIAARTRAASASRSAYSSPAVGMGGITTISTSPGVTARRLPRGMSRRVPRQTTGTTGSPAPIARTKAPCLNSPSPRTCTRTPSIQASVRARAFANRQVSVRLPVRRCSATATAPIPTSMLRKRYGDTAVRSPPRSTR